MAHSKAKPKKAMAITHIPDSNHSYWKHVHTSLSTSTLLQVSFILFVSLTISLGIPKSMRILYKTSHLTESWASLNSMHCLIVSPPLFSLKYVTNPKYIISNRLISSKPTMTIPNNFLLHRQQVNYTLYIYSLPEQPLAKYSQTLIQHHPHLAPMEVCKQKFPFIWYFNVLPPSSIYHHKLGCTVRYYSCDDTKMKYGWMDWKLTI